jgi:hypothetical protein
VVAQCAAAPFSFCAPLVPLAAVVDVPIPLW